MSERPGHLTRSMNLKSYIKNFLGSRVLYSLFSKAALALLITSFTLSGFTLSGVASAQSTDTFTVSQGYIPPPSQPAPEPSPPEARPSVNTLLKILGFSVQPSFYQATIKVQTNLPAKLFLRFGETPDYEMGAITSADFRDIHLVTIPGLTPNTLYFFEFEVVSGGVLEDRIKITNQKFKTLDLLELPPNVSNLKAVGDQEKITLTWRNPPIDFKNIRIIRSAKFFPRDPFDGELVYEDRGEIFVDRKVEKEVIYYYAVFVEDLEGRFSSGAITSARLLKPGEVAVPIDLFAGIVELPPSQVHPLINELTLKDFDFIQDGEKADFIDDYTVLIKGDRMLKVALSYDKLPEVLKTIAFTLADPARPDRLFQFLLRVNQDKTSYEALIAPLEREDLFTLGVNILDHKNRGLKKLAGFLKSILPFLGGVSIPPRSFYWPLIYLLLALLLLFLLTRIFSRHPFASKRYEMQFK
ncbi:MAG: hypothetical protein G01um1014107_246 [Parcubacteria group bacterium Gr01-1014_107]|nr:MAG: hypothetical protein G01um1014107_246 [Parcubacteria group bacterium Gr01-1014_107]